MKFSELKQAMDWRRRVGFNGGGYVKKKVLPQPKPKEEAEKVNKARKEKTFEKAKPALENPKEVKEMIDKPKRGLVDEPGSYSGEKVLKTYSPGFVRLEDYQDGTPRYRVSLIRTTEDGKKVSVKEKFKNYKKAKEAFDNFDKKYPKTLKGEKETKKLLPKFKTLINKPKKYPSQNSILKKLEIDKGTFNRLLKFYKEEGNVLPENRFPGIDTSLAGGKRQQIIDAYKANRTLNIQDLATKFKVDRTTVRRTLKNAGLRDPSEFQNISDPKKKTKTKSRYKTLKKITDVPYETSILGNDYVNLHHGDSKRFNVTTRTLGYAPPRINSFLLPKLETYLNNLYDQREDLLKKKPKNLVRKLEEINIKGMNLVSNPQVKGYLNFKIMDPKTLKMSDFGMDIATTIDPADLLKGKNIKDLSDFDKGIIELNRKEVMAAEKGAALPSNVVYGRGGPQPGKGQRSVYGKQAQKIVQDVERVSEKQIKDIFDNLKIKNTDTTANAARKIKNSPLPPKIKNTLLGVLGLGGGSLVGDLFRPVQADEPGVQEATSVLPTAAGAGTGAAAVGTKTGRNILGKAFRILGTPLSGLGFAGTNVYSKMKEGQSLADAVVDPITGLELSFPGLFKENLSKIISERAASAPGLKGAAAKFGRGLLGLGRIGRLMTPVGLGLATLGQAQDFYNQYQNLQRMKRDDPEAYQQFLSTRQAPALSAAEQTAIEDMGRSGAAGGGIMKMAGKSSGPPPESGPTSQGLDFLMKRGRQY